MPEYENCLRDFASMSPDGCRIETKLVDNKLIIKFSWFDYEMNDYRAEIYKYQF